MEKYFENGTLSDEELQEGIRKALAQSKLCPVFAGAAIALTGIYSLLESIVNFAPHPEIRDTEPASAHVFRTISETFGRITLCKLRSGIFGSDLSLINSQKSSTERLGPLHVILGKTLEKQQLPP